MSKAVSNDPDNRQVREHQIQFENSGEDSVLYDDAPDQSTVQTPLIQPLHSDQATGTIRSTTLNLTKTIVGAGIVALPDAVKTYGLVISIVILALVAYFVHFSLISLVNFSEKTRKMSYPGSVRVAFGIPGMLLLQLSIICYNLGMMIVYLIVIGDVLVGSSNNNYDGLITGWSNIHSGNVWYVSKPFILAVVVAVMIPVIIQKQITKMASVSAFGMGLAVAFTMCIVILFVVQLVTNPRQLDVRLYPDPVLMQQDNFTIVTKLLSVLGVFLTAYMCHYNLHPLMEELGHYTIKRMTLVVDLSMIVTAVLYFLVGVGGFVVFGSETQGDVLKNFSAEYLGPIIGSVGSEVMYTIVRIGYCIVLMTTYPLVLFSLRQRLLDFVRDGRTKQVMWGLITIVCVGATYILAVVLPDIQVVIRFVGCTAAVIMAFMFPALGALYVDRKRCWSNTISGILLFLGALLFVTGFENIFAPSPEG